MYSALRSHVPVAPGPVKVPFLSLSPKALTLFGGELLEAVPPLLPLSPEALALLGRQLLELSAPLALTRKGGPLT